MKRLIMILLLMLLTRISLAAEDNCDRALQLLSQTHSDVIAVNWLITRLPTISITVYGSKDCAHYHKLFTNQDPDWLHGHGKLCGILDSSEIKPGLCSLKTTYCSLTQCQQSVIQLFHDKNGHYTEAAPSVVSIQFDK